MVPNESLINAVRSQGFSFKRQTDRMAVYKQRGGTKRVLIRRNASHDEIYAREILRTAGMPDADIEKFLTACRQ